MTLLEPMVCRESWNVVLRASERPIPLGSWQPCRCQENFKNWLRYAPKRDIWPRSVPKAQANIFSSKTIVQYAPRRRVAQGSAQTNLSSFELSSAPALTSNESNTFWPANADAPTG